MGRNNADFHDGAAKKAANDAYIKSRGQRYAQTLSPDWDSRIGENDKCDTCGGPATKFSWNDGFGDEEHPV